jgi:D-alanine-D-alanine ligase
MKNIAIIMEAIPANIKFHYQGNVVYQSLEKQNTTAFAYIFQRKWVYVDDAETEFPR